MLIQPYKLDELRFASAYHVYYRWQTSRRRPIKKLEAFDQLALQQIADEFQINVLQATFSATECLTLLSLRPTDSVSVVASKLKGRISKWIGQGLPENEKTKWLKAGYFACTSGKATTEQVTEYLDNQGAHHGYENHACPPLFVQQWPMSPDDDSLGSAHAVTVLNFHCVLATFYRHGVFTAQAAETVAQRWREIGRERKFFLRKVSFVPDHVHMAIQIQPTVSPGEVVLQLMNTAQEQMFAEFPDQLIQAKAERLWQPSAYIGSYGDFASPMIQQYVRRWSEK